MIQEDAPTTPASPVPQAERGQSFRQWYLVAVLTSVYILNYVDRGALNLIVNPIKADLGITDVQMSLLLGLSFAVLYSLLSVPAGYLADIISRRKLLSSAIVFWSCMASICGFANSYWQLFAGRIGLGVGEAVLPPSAFSLIREGVRPVNRGVAFAIYHTGPYLGNAVGALVGGSLFALGASGKLHWLPIYGNLKPWQLVIAIPALAGIPIALLLLTVREPKRSSPTTGADTPTFGELFHYIGGNWKMFVPLFSAMAIGTMSVSGWSAWLPAALGRTWGMSTPQIGHMIGSIAIICLPVNALFMGWLMDRVSRGIRPHVTLFITIAASWLHLIPAMLVLNASSTKELWAAYTVMMLLGGGPSTSIVLAYITPGRLMGKMTSLFYLCANLGGLTFGPTVYALISQNFFSGPNAIMNAIMVCYPTITITTTVLYAILAVQVRRWYRTHGGDGGGSAPQ